MDWIVYQRDDCHLCDQALAVLAEAGWPEFDSVFIDEDELLEARYGLQVPVLQHRRSGRVLAWPFDAATARAFLQAVV